MVSDWGGMTFLIPYVLFVVLIGASGVIEEMALGRAAKGGPIKAFGCCTEIRTGKKKTGEIVGVIPVLGSLALAIGYTVVVGWIFKYAFLAISGGLFQFHQDMDAIAGLFGSTASAFGNNMWLVIAMVVTAVIMAFGIAGGIERANKVMMPLLFVLFKCGTGSASDRDLPDGRGRSCLGHQPFPVDLRSPLWNLYLVQSAGSKA
jgi:neurotransmitter:Na+ symporter, NSS family